MAKAEHAEQRARMQQHVVAWLEQHFGGSVVNIRRQPRWRPVWFADVQSGGEELQLCIRGERADAQIGFSLAHEMRFQKVLAAHAIPVAKIYGWINNPPAYVMARVPGRADFAGVSADTRRAVMADYMQVLARIHALPIADFAKADILRAKHPQQAGQIGMQTYERAYRAGKVRPDPLLEFCLAWLKRHPLNTRGRETPIVWDSGQFHHAGGKVQAVLDLEIAHIGDPLMDLAGFRMRDTIIGYGEFPQLYQQYAALSGRTIEKAALQHHHFAFTLTNQLAFHSALANPPPGSDYMTNLHWCSETNLFAMEALAEIHGLELPAVEEAAGLPAAAAAAETESAAAVAHRHLVHWLRHFVAPDAFAQNEVRAAFRLARHLQRYDEIGREAEALDLQDLQNLLGARPANWLEGAALLERFVLADAKQGAHDRALMELFHRRLARHKLLLGPPGSAIARHLPIQNFAAD